MKTSTKVAVTLLALAIAGIASVWALRSKVASDVPSEKVKIAAKLERDPFHTLGILEQLIPVFIEMNDPVLTRHAQNVQAKLPELKKLFASSFSGCRGMKIDFILQMHESNPDLEAAVPAELASKRDPKELARNKKKWTSQSQREVVGLIVKNKYEATVLEGNVTDGAGIAALAEDYYLSLMDPEKSELRESYEKQGVNFTSFKTARAIIIDSLRRTSPACSDNACKNREIEGYYGDYLAGEDRDLLKLTIQLIKVVFVAGLTDSKNVEIAVTYLSMIRSEYAVAKAIAFMRKQGIKNSVVVFGGHHADDFRQIASEIGLDSTIWDTAHTKTRIEQLGIK